MNTYDRTSRINHWGLAVLFLGMLLVGLILAYGDLAKPTKIPLLLAHKSMGVLLLIWAVWRVVYRLVQGFATPVTELPRWQELASKAVHYVLLLVVLGMPLSGLIMSLYSGQPTGVFGIITIPAIDAVPEIAKAGRLAHKLFAYLFICALFLHIGAALKHHFINRDKSLIRMIKSGS